MLPSDILSDLRSTAFVLVYGKLCHGGIETMILRLSKKISDLGAYACIVCSDGGDLDEAVKPYADIFYQTSLHDIPKIAHLIARKTSSYRSTIIISFDTGASTRAVYLEQLRVGKGVVKNITGIFHPHAYFMPGQPADRILLNKITLVLYGGRNTFFMNEECRRSHSARFGIDYSVSPIIILPVIDGTGHAPKYAPRSKDRPDLRILSVGRLVPFKAYNRGAPAIVKSLLAAGLDVQWDVYGYGPDEEHINSTARHLGVSNHLHLRGKLSYGSLSSIIGGYDIFIGMGTAALEAAALGLPSICAIIDRENECYGFVHELPIGNVGEAIAGRHPRNIDELLVAYAKQSTDLKLKLIGQSIAYCKNYEIEAFLHSLMAMAKTARDSRQSLLKWTASRLICEFTEGRLGKLMFNNGIKSKITHLLKHRNVV